MSKVKVGVQVVSGHNLLPKDGQGSTSAFVELSLDGQKFRTTVKEKDLNPHWNETFYFNISDPDQLPNQTLEAHVYCDGKNGGSKSSIGKVRITGTSFVHSTDVVESYYPLEKGSLFSRCRGELCLRVFYTDDPNVRSSNNNPQMDSSSQGDQVPDLSSDKSRNGKKSSRRTFQHLPNGNHQPSQQKSRFSSIDASQALGNNFGQFRAEPHAPRVVQTYADSSSQPFEFALKETSPVLGGGQIVGGRVKRADNPAGTYDLVEPMQFLYVRVVKARDLPSKDATGSLDPYVEVRVGNYRGVTKHFEKWQNPEWNTVFAFSEERIQSSVIEVVVKDKDMLKDDFVGMVRFDVHEVPRRVPPDSPLAPEWYRLEGRSGEKKKGELMLAVWTGTQADEAYSDAWHSDAVGSADPAFSNSLIRSKVYHSPRLWYLRVNVIEAQDLVAPDKNRFLDVYVKVQIGGQVLRTRPVQAQTTNAVWNEELIFVAAEPFEDHLFLSVEDRVSPNKEDTFGKAIVPLTSVEKRLDDRAVPSRWFNLQNQNDTVLEEEKRVRFASRIHVRASLDGGYHVLDESTHYSSDLRPTAKQLWKPPIGMLELGVLSADGLHPMKTRDSRGVSDTYCVAKYGHKWIRTRTMIDSLNPKYNEQYTWEVFDPSTVLTVAVFDSSDADSNSSKDKRVGKVRIRISTLETGRVYTHSYPLLVLHPSGVKKMGELHLAIRFSCTSFMNMMTLYSKPPLPKMHYVRPLTIMQQEMLRHQAVNIVAARLGRAEPPLRKEVVEYMTDADYHLWSMRRSKANFFRLMSVFSGLLTLWKWFGDVCTWKNPVTTSLVHVLFVMLVCFPELILPTGFIYMFVIGLWNYRYRPMYPPHMNTTMSYADAVHPDELDEEFDTFPTSKSSDLVRMRYDRLRSVAGRIQSVIGDIASQGERIQGLLSWRDPRATVIFVTFCLVAAIVLYVTPFQALAVMAGFYTMRHPRFRHRLPPVPLNFFRRLPARTDSML